MSHVRYSTDEIAEGGQALYESKIRDRLDSSARGKFLALVIETGEYEIDADERTALKRARAKNPGAALYLLRIGFPTAYRLRIEREEAQAQLDELAERIGRAWRSPKTGIELVEEQRH